jgi:hypothetical protein
LAQNFLPLVEDVEGVLLEEAAFADPPVEGLGAGGDLLGREVLEAGCGP